jgi:hypothetical protein
MLFFVAFRVDIKDGWHALTVFQVAQRRRPFHGLMKWNDTGV